MSVGKGSDKTMVLERVLGLTSLSSASMASSISGDVFYHAGCVCVQYSPSTNKQIGFFNAQKPISCIAVSKCGKYLAAGERGHQPCVCVFSIHTREMIARLGGHKHGIGCMVFSPDSKYLVSCGFKHDKQIMLWNWENAPPVLLSPSLISPRAESNQYIASNTRPLCTGKIGSKVHAIDFHETGSYFVTAGESHFKFWKIERMGDPITGIPIHLSGNPGTITKELVNTSFMDVICGTGPYTNTIFTCTSAGYLCAFHDSRALDTWVKLESPTAYSLALYSRSNTEGLLVVGCAEGIIRAFSPSKLTYLATLPLPVPLLANVATDEANVELEYAACYALCKVPGSNAAPVPKLAAIYADRSFVVWDITDIYAVAQHRSFSFHRACVWDVSFIDRRKEGIAAANDKAPQDGQQQQQRCLPPGTFVTCSADSTIRVWNLDPRQQRASPWKSPHSREMLHCLELTHAHAQVQDKGTNTGIKKGTIEGDIADSTLDSGTRNTPPRRNTGVASSPSSKGVAGIGGSTPPRIATGTGKTAAGSSSSSSSPSSSTIRGSAQDGGITKALSYGTSTETINFSIGIPDTELPHRPLETMVAPRALAIHPCGTQLACGDKAGRLRVYDLHTMRLIHTAKSHEAEILTMHYSPPCRKAKDGSWGVDYSSTNTITDTDSPIPEPLTLLATAGRDRLIHIYDVNKRYHPLSTLDNHSSSIMAVKFTADGKRLLSCGGDRTMVFSNVVGPEITRIKSVQTPHGTVNGLALEPTNKFAVTSGQDNRLNIWNVQSGRHMRTYKSVHITQELYKADVDPSGMFVAASAFDKTINIFDFFSGELLSQVTGHSEVVTGVRFSLDGRHLVSIGGDGCIMVWRLHESLVAAMQDRLVELYGEAVQKQYSVLRRSQNSLRKLREKEAMKAIARGEQQVDGQGQIQGQVQEQAVSPVPPPNLAVNKTSREEKENKYTNQVVPPAPTGVSSSPIIPLAAPVPVIKSDVSITKPIITKSPTAAAVAAAAVRGGGGAGKWNSRLQKEGGYQLFGRQVGPALQPDKHGIGNNGGDSSAGIEFTGIINTNGIDIDVELSNDSQNHCHSQSSNHTNVLAISARIANTVEDDDDVMHGSDSDDHDEDGEDEEEDEEEDGEALFRVCRNSTPSPEPQSSRGEGLRSNSLGHLQSLSQSQKGLLHLRKSLEDSAKIDTEAEDDDTRTKANLDELERTALGLESWLEAKLKGETTLDSAAVAVIAVVDAQQEDEQQQQREWSEGQGQEKKVKSLNGVNDDRGLLSTSLSAAFFLSNRKELTAAATSTTYSATNTNESAAEVEEQLLTNESAATVDTNVSAVSASSSSSNRSSRSSILASKRRQTSAALAHMKHQLHGMGLYEGTVGQGGTAVSGLSPVATSGSVSNISPIEDSPSPNFNALHVTTVDNEVDTENEDTTTIPDEQWNRPVAAVVMPPSPPHLTPMKVNQSIDSGRLRIALQLSAEKDKKQGITGKVAAAATTTVATTVVSPKESTQSGIKTERDEKEEEEEEEEVEAQENNKNSFRFSLSVTSELPTSLAASVGKNNEGDESKKNDSDDDGDTISNATDSTITGNGSARGSLDFSLTGREDDDDDEKESVPSMDSHTHTPAESEVEDQNKNEKEGEDEGEISILELWNGDGSVNTAVEQGQGQKEGEGQGEVSTLDIGVNKPLHSVRQVPTGSPVRPNSNSITNSPSHVNVNVNVSQINVNAVAALPSQAILKEKLDSHAAILSELNRAKAAALRSYNELLGLRTGLVDVSASFSESFSSSSSSSISRGSIIIGTSGVSASAPGQSLGSWKHAEDAEAALDFTDSILSNFRKSFADFPQSFSAVANRDRDRDGRGDREKSRSSPGSSAHANTHSGSGSGSNQTNSSSSGSEKSDSGRQGSINMDMDDTTSTTTSTILAGAGASANTGAGTFRTTSPFSATATGEYSADVERLLESHSDKLMEKLLAKLGSKGINLDGK